MTGTVVTHKTQVGQSNTAANNFTIRTLDDGSLRISRGNAGAETSDVLVIDADGNFSTAPVLGVGQTWQNLTGSRVAGTTYTNTTGRPIMICVGTSGAGFSGIEVIVNGLPVIGNTTDSYTGTDRSSVSVVIPNANTYSITADGTITWLELR